MCVSAEPWSSITQVELNCPLMTILFTMENISLTPVFWGRPMSGTIDEVNNTHIVLIRNDAAGASQKSFVTLKDFLVNLCD